MIEEVPPEITRPPANVTLTLGQSVNLTCISEGVPVPIFTWFKDGEQIEGAVLPFYYIATATPDDRGYYYCIAENDAGVDRSFNGLLALEGM